MSLKIESLGRLFEPPASSFFLFGPRGTGKSSWVRSALPDAQIIDLLEPDTQRSLAAHPERLHELIAAEPKRKTVVLDEVQKAPELLSVVHSLRERDPSLRFILTGSSARKLRRGGSNLLGGRAVLRTLHPFMAAELGDRFDLDAALRHGLVPLILAASDPLDALKAYHALYLKEEVQQEGLVRNVGAFARFLEAISFSHAAQLNLANVARECEVERRTVESFVGILEDLLLAFRLPVFARRAQRAVVVHPKFFFFDAGVYRTARPTGALDSSREIEGAALEGLVAQHLRAWNAYRGEPNRLHYWRTRGGAEVDFVIYGPDGFWAIEVKSSERVDRGDLRSLKTFHAEYPEAKVLLLHRGRETLEIDGIRCIPCDAFLRGLTPSKLIE